MAILIFSSAKNLISSWSESDIWSKVSLWRLGSDVNLWIAPCLSWGWNSWTFIKSSLTVSTFLIQQSRGSVKFCSQLICNLQVDILSFFMLTFTLCNQTYIVTIGSEDLTGDEESLSSKGVKELVWLEFFKLLMDFMLEKLEILTVAGIST